MNVTLQRHNTLFVPLPEHEITAYYHTAFADKKAFHSCLHLSYSQAPLKARLLYLFQNPSNLIHTSADTKELALG